jgi:hypothetical protein
LGKRSSFLKSQQEFRENNFPILSKTHKSDTNVEITKFDLEAISKKFIERTEVILDAFEHSQLAKFTRGSVKTPLCIINVIEGDGNYAGSLRGKDVGGCDPGTGFLENLKRKARNSVVSIRAQPEPEPIPGIGP